MFKDEEEASDVVQKLLPKKRNLQFTLPPPNSPDSRRFSLEPTLNYLEVPLEKSPLIYPCSHQNPKDLPRGQVQGVGPPLPPHEQVEQALPPRLPS